MGTIFKSLAAILSATVAMSLLVAACSTPSVDQPASPVVTQQIVPTEAAEPEQVDDQGVFLRVIASLDEERGYCLDIPGHLSGVRLGSPLQAHTCKHEIWNLDGRFDVTALANGQVERRLFTVDVDGRNISEEAIAPTDLLFGGDGIALLIEESSQRLAEALLRKDGVVSFGPTGLDDAHLTNGLDRRGARPRHRREGQA